MAWMDRIRAANRYSLTGLLRFRVAGQAVGWVRPDFAARLGDWPEVFDVRAGELRLAPALDDPAVPAATRTEAVAGVLAALHERGVLDGWRDELYPVATSPFAPPLLLVERAAVPRFGIQAYGVHVNGVVRDGGSWRMWVARRAWTKPTFPGELDQMVAGGQPAGISLLENVVKECAEEAAIPRSLALRARPVGAIRYCCDTPEGLRPDVIYDYDLELPPDFEPVNADGEVHSFELWDVERLMTTVHDTDDFKFNCSLVVIDWLIRSGLIGPEDPQYLELLRGLQGWTDALSAAP